MALCVRARARARGRLITALSRLALQTDPATVGVRASVPASSRAPTEVRTCYSGAMLRTAPLSLLTAACWAATVPDSQQQLLPPLPRESERLSVRAFGAKGDGVADDAVAIQRAINASQAEHRTLWFPSGTYVVNTTLVVGCTDGQTPSTSLGPRYPVHLSGDGSMQAIIKAGGARLHAVLSFASVARGFNKTPRGTTTDVRLHPPTPKPPQFPRSMPTVARLCASCRATESKV